MSWAVAVVFALVCLSLSVMMNVGQSYSHAEDDADNIVVEHYQQLGAVLRARIGRTCPSCLRGLIATEDFRSGQVVFEIPRRLIHFLHGDFGDDSTVDGYEVGDILQS